MLPTQMLTALTLHIDDLLFSFAHGKFSVTPTYLAYEILAARSAVGFSEPQIVFMKLTFYSSNSQMFSVVTRLCKRSLEQY